MLEVKRPRITVLASGGTIAMTRGDCGAIPRLGAEELVAQVPALENIAQITAETVRLTSSENLDINAVVEMAERIVVADDGSVDGFVVTMGTDSLEEHAFALDVLLRRDVPVVLTGAMRIAALPSADGPANLLTAIRVASSAAARGLGVLVALNEEIHCARFVRKTHTYALNAFSSRPCGPIGWVVEDRVRIVQRPIGRTPHVPLESKRAVPYVALATTFGGDDGRTFSLLENAKLAGLVIEALGSGHVAEGVIEPATRMAQRIPVVLTSRVSDGDLFRRTYEHAGGEIDLFSRGIICGGFIGGPKARALLTILLAADMNRDEISLVFEALEAL